MNKYLIIPDGCKWEIIEAASAEMAYSTVCHWYNANKKIVIVNSETNEFKIYTRVIDYTGNLVKIIEH